MRISFDATVKAAVPAKPTISDPVYLKSRLQKFSGLPGTGRPASADHQAEGKGKAK
jgi:hypothetical protein